MFSSALVKHMAPVSLVSDFPRPSPMTILGYRLHPMTGVEVVEQISSAVREERRLIMANLNVHAMAVMYDSPGMARLFAQDDCLVMVDGMPILLIANIFYRAGLRRDKRTTSLDFYNEMFGLGASCGWKFAYIGGTADVLARGMDVLTQRFPGLKIEGRDGYFDFPNNSPTSAHQEILGWLRDYSPDVVIVGMGMPRQEEWIELIQNQIDARVFLPTGAYLDYQVGAQKPAPRWLGRYGLEGAYRLMRSPYRLGYRYLVEPFVLGYRILTGSPISTTRPDPTKSRI